MKKITKYAGLALVSLFFVAGGQAHFTSTPFFVSIVPPYVPFPLATVYVTGVLELIGAVAIWVPRWRSWAGIGLLALTVCVTPANIYMWMNPQLFPDISRVFWDGGWSRRWCCWRASGGRLDRRVIPRSRRP